MRSQARVQVESVPTVWLDIIFGVLIICLMIVSFMQRNTVMLLFIAVSIFTASISFYVYRSILHKISRIMFHSVECYLVLDSHKVPIDSVALDFLSGKCVVFTLHLGECVNTWPLKSTRLPICLFSTTPSWQAINTNTDFHSVFVACKTGYIHQLVNR